jgi:hypothetical protein
MGEQSFYVQIKFTPRAGIEMAKTKHEAVVEVPKELVRRKQSEVLNEMPREKEIALDLARRAALGLFLSHPERVVGLYHEDAIWYEEEPRFMKERPCDHEENGIRVWRGRVQESEA